MSYRKKLVVDVPDDVSEVELRHPNGDIEDVEIETIAEDDEEDSDDDSE